MKKYLVKTLPILLVATFILAACSPAAQQPATSGGNNNAGGATTSTATGTSGGPADSGQPSARDELMIVVATLPNSLDPHATIDNPASLVRNNMYDPLMRLDPITNELSPALAVDWSMPDGQTVNMELRQGVTFHNGMPFTAADVVFSIERALASPTHRAYIEMVDYIEIIDDYNISIHLHYPYAPILNRLSFSILAIVPEQLVREIGDDAFADRPVGTGPFKFEEYILGDRVVLERNDDWWGEAPAIRQMTFRQIAEQTNRFIEVETGNADIAIAILPSDISRAETTDNVNLLRRSNRSFDYVAMNLRDEGPLQDLRVREAITHALQMEAIVTAAFSGSGSVADSPMTPMSNYHVSTAPYVFDIERARELMAEAGYADGFNVNFWTNSGNQPRADVAEMIQNQLRAINISVNIEVLEWATFIERTTDGDHDMMMIGWSGGDPDPDSQLFNVFHSSNFGGAGNRAFYHNPDVDRWLDEGRSEVNSDVRRQLYENIQHQIRADIPVLFVRHGEELDLSTPAVRGYVPGSSVFWEVYFVE